MAKYLKQNFLISFTHPKLVFNVVKKDDIIRVSDYDATTLLSLQQRNHATGLMANIFTEVAPPSPGVAYIDLSTTQTVPSPLLTYEEQRQLRPRTVGVVSSRTLTADDDGACLEVAGGVVLTLPAGMPTEFGVTVMMVSGTVTIRSAGGVLLNGATTDITRAASSNAMFAIVSRMATDAYLVLGS